MVVGHSGCPDAVYRFIYLFHMPLFFFCSGIFMKDMVDNKVILSYLKKRISGLYFPFVKWSITFLLFHNIFMLIGIYNSSYGYEGGSYYYTMQDVIDKTISILFMMHDYEELLGGFWFIRSLFITSILIACFSFIMRKIKKYKYLIGCFLFFSITVLIRRLASESDLGRDMSLGTLGALFYIFGFIFVNYSKYWLNKYVILSCCCVLFALNFYFRTGVSMECGYNKVFPFSIAALSGIFLTLYLARLIDNNCIFLKYVFYYIGNHTLEILALHFLSFRFVSCCLALWYNLDFVHIAEHPVIKNLCDSYSYCWILYCMGGIIMPLFFYRIWHFIIRKIVNEDIL